MTDYEYQQQLEEQQQQGNAMNFEKLAAINVNEHIEKKGNLSYLSWAWAVDQLLRNDPLATWSFGEPVRWNDTAMVFCTVNAFGKSMTMQLPVMDHKNKAIANPDAMQVNTAMMRCLAKAIALHGIGLYIYAGEDLPMEDAEAKAEAEQRAKDAAMAYIAKVSKCASPDKLTELWANIPAEVRPLVLPAIKKRKAALLKEAA